jgi:hypothetical protein
MTKLRHVLIHQVVSSPYGNRTDLAALKGRYPSPIDERAVLCVLNERKVAREALESSSAVLQAAADQRKRRCPRLRYQPKLFQSGHEKTRCRFATPGLVIPLV